MLNIAFFIIVKKSSVRFEIKTLLLSFLINKNKYDIQLVKERSKL